MANLGTNSGSVALCVFYGAPTRVEELRTAFHTSPSGCQRSDELVHPSSGKKTFALFLSSGS